MSMKNSVTNIRFKPFQIQLWILLFPPLDMLSVFPLVTITCGNNLIQLLPLSWRQKHSQKFLKVITRLITAIPPIILGAAMGNLKEIFQITGLFAFCLMIVVPCALELFSKIYMHRYWGQGSELTDFQSFLSKPLIVYGVLVYGVVGLSFCILCECFPFLFADPSAAGRNDKWFTYNFHST